MTPSQCALCGGPGGLAAPKELSCTCCRPAGMPLSWLLPKPGGAPQFRTGSTLHRRAACEHQVRSQIPAVSGPIPGVCRACVPGFAQRAPALRACVVYGSPAGSGAGIWQPALRLPLPFQLLHACTCQEAAIIDVQTTRPCADVLSPQATPTYGTSGASGASPFAAAAALPDAAPALPETWEGVCQWVMGGQIALWDEMFEKAFLQVFSSSI